MARPRCFLDISIGGELEGRMVVELYNDIVPKAAENFRALCTGERGISLYSGVPLHYKGTRFHRVVSNLSVVGGDFVSGDGFGGESIYGPMFEDENFRIKHVMEGIVSMHNLGRPNSNNSVFLIFINKAHHFDGKHVAFGRIIRGLEVLQAIKRVPLVEDIEDFVPSVDVVIENCGEILESGYGGTCNLFNDGDMFAEWPDELQPQPTDIAGWMEAILSIKAKGNESFKGGDYKMALRKYCKALRYLEKCWEMTEIDEVTRLSLKNARSQIRSNCSACKLKLGDLTGALHDATSAILDAEDNSKAFYRQGQACMALDDLDSAVTSFKSALHLEPNNAGIRKELAAARKKIANRLEKDKGAYWGVL